MSKVVLDMSMSVDGFITGPDDGLDQGLGVNGERLHDWLGAGSGDPRSYRPVDGPGATVFDELMATGAVIVGRRTFEFAGGWAGDHHDGVPIFVLTHAAPDDPRRDMRVTSPTASNPASRRPRPRPVAATSCCTAPRPRRSAFVPGCWTRWSYT
jgi:dihydrofolate reductase